MKNVVLIGFMGSGKTTVGKKLATKLNWEFVDTDSLIEKREGRTIKEIFEKDKEPYFRKVEKEVIKGISAKEGVVISCGGGAVLDEENVKVLKSKGFLVYLKASLDTIYERVKSSSKRPLLNVSDKKREIKRLLAKREGIYKRIADLIVDTDKKRVDEIVEILEKKVRG